MADTKKLTDRKMRKGVKRSQRKALKKAGEALTQKDRRSLRKEPRGVRAFLAEKAKAAAAE